MSRLDAIRKLLDAEPQDVFLNFSLGMEYVKAGRPEEAVAQFELLHGIAPAYVPAYFQQANTLVAMNRREEAKAVFARGIEVARANNDRHAADEMAQALKLLS